MEPKDVVSDIEVFTDKESQTVDIFHSQVNENTCLQISDKPFPADRRKTPAYARLLAISNIYGYMVAGTCKGLSVFTTADAQNELSQGKSKGTNTLVSLAAQKEVDMSVYGQVSHIGLTADELQVIVATSTGKLVILSAASLLDKNAAGPGKEVKTIDLGTEIRDVRTNPQEMPSLVAVLTLAGDVQMVDISSSSVKCIAAARDQITTSICWSRKGKQIICGDSSAVLKQRVPTDGTVKRTIKPQNGDDSIQPDFGVLAVDWIDTYTFFVLYGPFPEGALVPNNGGGGSGASDADDGVDDNMTVSYVITKSGKSAQTQQWIYIEDPCSSMMCPTRYPGFHVACLPDWGESARNIVLMAGTGSDATMTIGQAITSDAARGGDADLEWAQWDIDGAMAVMPRSAVESSDSSDTFPIGLAIDYTATRDLPPVTDDGERVPSVPIMWILNTDACLLGYHIYNTYEMRRGGRCSKMVDQVKKLPIPSISGTGSSFFRGGSLSREASAEPFASGTASRSSSQEPGALPAAFSGSPFGGKQPSFGGSSAFGASAGFAPSFGKPPTAAGVTGQPVFGSSSKLGATATTASGFGGFGQAAPENGKSIFDQPSGGPSIFDTPSNGSSAFGAAKASAGMGAFGNTKPASGFGGFGASSSGQTSGAFGGATSAGFGKSAASTVLGSSSGFGQTSNDMPSVFGGMGALGMTSQAKADKKPEPPMSNNANKGVFGAGSTTAKPFGSNVSGAARMQDSSAASGSSRESKSQPAASLGGTPRPESPSEAASKRREKEEKERKDREEKERKDREEKERKDREEKEAKEKEQREKEEKERKERERVEGLRRQMESKTQDLLNRQYISTCNAFDSDLKALAASVKSTDESIADVRSAKLSPIQIDPTILSMTSLSASLNDLCLDDTDSWNSVADVLLEALQVSSEELRASQKLLGKHVAQYVKIQTKQEEVKRIIETATSAIASPNATINDGLDPLQRECRKSLLNLYGHVSNTLDDIEVVLDDRVKPIETFNGSLSIDRKLCDLSQRLSEKNYELDQLSSSLDLLKIGKSADDAREAIQSSGLPSDVPCSSIPAVLPAASPLTAAQGTPWSPEDLPFSTPVAARRNRGFGLREEDLYTSSNPVSARAPTSPEKTSEEPKSPVAAPGSHSHPLFSKSKVRELVPRSHKVNRKASMALDDTSLDNTNLTDSEFSSSAMYLQVRQQRQMVRDLLTNSHRAAPVVRTPNANASVASSAVPVQNVAMPNLERYVGAFGKLKITKRVPTPEPVVPAPNAGASFGSVPSFGGGFNPTGGASLFGSGPATGSGFGGPLSSSHAMTSAPPANGQFTSFVPPPGAPPMAQGFRPTFGAAPASGQTLPNPASISFGSDEKWVCDTCLVPNQPSAKICVACESPNPNTGTSSAPAPTSAPAPAPAPAPLSFGAGSSNSDATSIFGSGFGSTAGTSATPAPAASNELKWRCDMCLIENPPTTKICLACETPNSNTLDVSAGAAATPPSPLFGGKLMPTVLFGNSSGASTRTTAFSLGDLGEISTIGSGGQAMTAFIPPSNTRSAPTQPEYNSESDAGDTVDTDASEGYSDTGDDEAAHSCGSSEYSYDGDGDHVSGEVGEPDAEDAASNGSWEEYDSHGQGSDSADTTDSDEHPHVQESADESENDAEVPKDPRVSYNVDSGSKKDAEVPTEEDGSEAGSQKEVDGIEPEPTTDPSVVSAVEPIADAEADGEIPVISETKPEDIPEPTPEPESATVPEESTAEPDNGHSAGTEASVPAMPAVTAADVDGVHKDDSESKVDVGDNAESKDIETVPSEPQTQSISEPEKNAGAESTPELDTDSKEVGAEADKPHVELNDELGAVPQETEAETDELHTESNDKHRTEAEREANTSPASVTKDATEDKARSTEGSSDILEEPVIVSASDAASQSSKINDDDDLGVLSADDKDDGDDKLAATVPKSSEVDHGHDSDGFVHISQLASSNESKEDVSIGSEFMSVVEAQSAAPFDLDGMVKLIGGASIEDVVSYALDSITSASRAVEEEYDTAKVTPPQDEATTDHEHGDLSPASDSVPEDTADNAPVPDGFELLSRPESIVDAAIFDSQDAALSDNENKDSFGVGDIAARLTDAAATATSDKDEDSDDLIFNTSPPASPYLDLANDSESGSESDSVSIKDLKTKSEPESKPLSDIAQGAASFFQPGKFGSIGSGSSSFFRSGTGAFANVGKSTIAGTQQPSSGGIPSALTRSDAPIPEFGKNLGRPAFGVSSMSNTKPAKSRESSPGVSGVSGQMGPGFSARANASFNAFASYARNVGSVAEDEPSPVSPHVASISSVPRDKPKTSPPAEARNDRPNRNDDPLRHLIEGSDDEGRADPTNQDLDYDSD